MLINQGQKFVSVFCRVCHDIYQSEFRFTGSLEESNQPKMDNPLLCIVDVTGSSSMRYTLSMESSVIGMLLGINKNYDLLSGEERAEAASLIKEIMNTVVSETMDSIDSEESFFTLGLPLFFKVDDPRDISGPEIHSVSGQVVSQLGSVYLSVSEDLREVRIATYNKEMEMLVSRLNEAIDERLIVEDSLIEANTQIRMLLEKANASVSVRDSFMASMSHELRTPMNGIIGFSDILLKGELKEEQREFLQIIRRSAKDLLKLINNILDISKIESGKVEIEQISFDLEQLLFDVGQLLKPEINSDKIHYQFESDELESELMGDPTQIRQIVVNLLGNAIKFTESGSVTLRLIKKEEKEGILSFSIEVEDTGTGIARDKQKKIFEEFRQADESITRKYGGSGLGLSISQKLVKMMNGSISLKSELGKGTTFCVDLKLPTSSKKTENEIHRKDPEKNKKIAEEQVEEKSTTKIRVLIAEDNSDNMLVLQSMLNRMNVSEISLAEDGVVAVQKAKEKYYDLIFMDMQMPRMNGMDATKKIREAGIQSKIIALTANASGGDKKECLISGMDRYITKPTTYSEILQAVDWVRSQV